MGDRFRDYEVTSSQSNESDETEERLDEIVEPEKPKNQDMSEEGENAVS